MSRSTDQNLSSSLCAMLSDVPYHLAEINPQLFIDTVGHSVLRLAAVVMASSVILQPLGSGLQTLFSTIKTVKINKSESAVLGARMLRLTELIVSPLLRVPDLSKCRGLRQVILHFVELCNKVRQSISQHDDAGLLKRVFCRETFKRQFLDCNRLLDNFSHEVLIGFTGKTLEKLSNSSIEAIIDRDQALHSVLSSHTETICSEMRNGFLSLQQQLAYSTGSLGSTGIHNTLPGQIQNLYSPTHPQYSTVPVFDVSLTSSLSSPTIQVCVECSNAEATLYCCQCDTYLCQLCSVEIHRPRSLRNHSIAPVASPSLACDSFPNVNNVVNVQQSFLDFSANRDNNVVVAPSDEDIFHFDSGSKFEEVIRNCADIGRGTVIKIKNLRHLEKLDLFGIKSDDFTPLMWMINLKELILSVGNISDISPLSSLSNLIVLDLTRTRVSDVSPLADLVKLEVLFLQFTKIQDISPLSGLVNLRVLGLGNTRVKNLAPLSYLSLQYLILENSDVSDITPLLRSRGFIGEYRLRNDIYEPALFLSKDQVSEAQTRLMRSKFPMLNIYL
ncbi:hypothetical protein GEMRC1_002364 [Eukaryota sp. GEM-RC1]